MGEYAMYRDESGKIGTCEDMYYLRFDQRHDVIHERGNVDPVQDAETLRFRFPWPDEDHVAPGSEKFHDNGYHRGVCINGMSADKDTEHGHVQFVAQAGYNVCLPCPESLPSRQAGLTAASITINGNETTIHRNGFSGAVHLVSQRYRPGIGLVPVLRCGGCGAMWRVENRDKIEGIAVLLRSEGDKRAREDRNENGGRFWHQIADRVMAGITAGVEP